MLSMVERRIAAQDRRYKGLPSRRAMVRRVERRLDKATDEQRYAGARWYGRFGVVARLLAERNGVDLRQAAGVLAIVSPRVSVGASVWLADAILAAWSSGRPVVGAPNVKGLGERIGASARFLDGDEGPVALDADGRLTSSRKVRSFFANTVGDVDAVTVDVWMARALGFRGDQPEGGAYVSCAEAVRTVARRRGMTPREVQATVWCVERADIDAAGELESLIWALGQGMRAAA